MSDLSTAVFQALGAASTCWTDTAFGTFDSDRAVRIGDDLMAKIEAHVSDERDTKFAQLDHAEAVAAKLVEVICEQDRNARKDADAIFRLAQRDINAAIERDAWRADAEETRAERDAARARTVEAEQKVIDAHREVALARAEVAALAEKLAKCTDDKVAERVAFGKERNALKAEVAALRQALAVEQSRTTFARIAVREVLADLRDKVSSGWIPELDHEARIAVLALIEEADNA